MPVAAPMNSPVREPTPLARPSAESAANPPPWDELSTQVAPWHGCLDTDARDIATHGIDLTRGREALDFGRGFYTTTDREQAEKWARKRCRRLPQGDRSSSRPSLLLFHVPLARLARLESLVFVRGDAGHHAFWSFVRNCRLGTPASPRTHLHPTRAAPGDYYDVVFGPLAATWPPRGRVTILGSDQFSFHTAEEIAITSEVIASGRPGFQISELQRNR